MPEHKIGTRKEWQAARDELAKVEAEAAKRNEEAKEKRLELPWVPVEKNYEFDTEEGKKTLTTRRALVQAAPASRTASTVGSST
jgi:predicted dithiol-disulfide oxidoreductase (DUF899 family)